MGGDVSIRFGERGAKSKHQILGVLTDHASVQTDHASKEWVSLYREYRLKSECLDMSQAIGRVQTVRIPGERIFVGLAAPEQSMNAGEQVPLI